MVRMQVGLIPMQVMAWHGCREGGRTAAHVGSTSVKHMHQRCKGIMQQQAAGPVGTSPVISGVLLGLHAAPELTSC